jgi:hypothetical protein
MSRTIHLKLLALAGLSVALAAHEAPAATITVEDSVLDFEAQHRSNDGTYPASENNGAGRAGFQSNFNGGGSFAPGGIEPIFLFQLPALAPGESVTSATFSIGRVADSAASAVAPTFNADLYALGVTATAPTINTAGSPDGQHLFYIGDTAQSSLPAVAGSQIITGPVSRLADNFFVPSMFIANGGSAAPLDVTDVSSYIQNLYADPVGNGFVPGTSYLVMRINPDTSTPPSSGTQRYSVAWQGNSATTPGGNPGNGPFITLTTVPEPGSVCLATISLIGSLLVTRRQG